MNVNVKFISGKKVFVSPKLISIGLTCFITVIFCQAQNSVVGDGFGGRLWYRPYNYTAGSYAAFTVCGPDFQLYGWGSNIAYQLGHKVHKGSMLPEAIEGMNNVRFYSNGYNAGVIKWDNTGWIWGNPMQDTPRQVISNAKFVNAGTDYCSFVKYDGTVWSFGRNPYGAFGDGSLSFTLKEVYIPKKMLNIQNAVRVANGRISMTVLLKDGTLVSAGNNSFGGLGAGLPLDTTALIPVKIPNLKHIVDVKAAAHTMIALDSFGDVYAWGRNSFGGIGNGSNVDEKVTLPQKISALRNIVAISAKNDGEHFLALDENMNCYAWGANAYGQLGTGDLNQINTPVLIATNVVDIMAGETFSYMIKKDQSLWASGQTLKYQGSILLNLMDTAQKRTFVRLNPELPLCQPELFRGNFHNPEYEIVNCFNTYHFIMKDTSVIKNIHWDFGDTASKNLNQSNLKYPTHIYSEGGTYRVKWGIERYDGSIDTLEADVQVEIGDYKLDLGRDTVLCEGESLDLTTTLSGYQYLWQDSSESMQYTVTKSGKYWLRVYEGFCYLEDSIHVQVNSYPEIEWLDSFEYCGSLHLQLDAYYPGAKYLWSTGEKTSEIVVEKDGKYWVDVSLDRCESSDTIHVVRKPNGGLVFIPNSMSPNEDGVNDVFPWPWPGNDFYLEIYSRWGELIYAGNTQWDGTYQNEVVAEGVYAFFIKHKDCLNRNVYNSGTLTLVY